MNDELRDLARLGVESLRTPPPDLSSVRRRARTLRARRYALVGVAVLSVGAAGAVSVSAVTREPRPNVDVAAPRAVDDVPPEGRLLLQMGPRVEVLDAVRGRMTVDRGVHGFDLSPTGTEVVATVETLERGSGVTLHTAVVITDTTTGSRRTLLRAPPRSSLGDPTFSPDGSKVAFTLSTWRSEAALEAERPAQDAVCVAEVTSGEMRCFRNLGSVFTFDWSPRGDSLVVAGPGDQPVYVIDTDTQRASVLLPPGGSPSVRAALDRLDGFDDEADQFIDPKWSHDGSLVAVVASVTPGGWAPVVVDESGGFVAMGEANPYGLQSITWSPTAAILAHTTGYNGVGPPGATFGVHVLAVGSGETRLLHSTNDLPQPAILDVAWSPSGRWLALDNALSLEIVDTWGDEAPYTIHLGHDDPGDVPETLQDWGR